MKLSTKKNKFKIQYLPVTTLKTNPMNSKIHTAEQVEQIKESIKEFGFNDPVAVDEDYNIIEGHGRYIASVEMGFEKIPCFIIPGLSEEEKTAYSIVHNQLTNNTDFSADLLEDEISKIEEIDMSKYSFDVNVETFFSDDSDNYVQPKPGEKRRKIYAYPGEADVINLKSFLDEGPYKYDKK